MRASLALSLVALFLLILSSVNVCLAQDYVENGLRISVPFTKLTTERKTLSIPFYVRNNLNSSMLVSFSIDCPPGWSFSFLLQGYNVSEIFLEPEETAHLTLRLEPSEKVAEGTYNFKVYAFSGEIMSNEITITVYILKPTEIVELRATSLSVTGSPGSTFTFRFSIENKGYEDLTFVLSATLPEGWHLLGFRPSLYERRAISEITVKAQSVASGVVAEVWCPMEVSPGEYPVTVTIASGTTEKSLEFTAVVTGTHQVSLRTKEDLLSYTINAGETKEIILFVENKGTADLIDVRVSCDAPYGWKAVVSPERINTVPAGESRAVSLAITPPSGTIAGDYSVEVHVITHEASDDIELRITVTKPTFWGIIGLVIILVSVFGLILVFRKYGRP